MQAQIKTVYSIGKNDYDLFEKEDSELALFSWIRIRIGMRIRIQVQRN